MDGRVLFTGGWNAEGKHVDRNEIYDPATETMAVVGSMKVQRCYESIVGLRDGDVLVAGGLPCQPLSFLPALGFAEVFDARTETFRSVGNLIEPTWGPAAVLLGDGRVLLAGGGSGGSREFSSDLVEIYDPHTRIFVSAGHLTTRHKGPAAALRPDGTVLIEDGSQASPHFERVTRTAEIYDPANQRSRPNPADLRFLAPND